LECDLRRCAFSRHAKQNELALSVWLGFAARVLGLGFRPRAFWLGIRFKERAIHAAKSALALEVPGMTAFHANVPLVRVLAHCGILTLSAETIQFCERGTSRFISNSNNLRGSAKI
jgi:hypothetical protein